MKKLIIFFEGGCPRCGKGKVFESKNPYNLGKMMATHKKCENCQLDFVPEPGFYWGATYVSYAITVAFTFFLFAISTALFGFMESLSLKFVAANAVLLVIFTPIFFRISRMVWLWMFYKRD